MSLWKRGWGQGLIGLAMITALMAGCSERSGYRLLDGGRIDLQQSEKLLFINYWAVWCAPCIVEMPELAQFASDFANEVRVLGVNFDGVDPEQLRIDADNLGVRIELLLEDPQPELGYQRPEVLPTTYLVHGGTVVRTLIGPQTLESLEENLKWWKQTHMSSP